MRVAGDADACAQTAVALARAARVMGDVEQRLEQARCGLPAWQGTAAHRWHESSSARPRTAHETASRLAAAGQALGTHGRTLQELQSRAAALQQEAEGVGLLLDQDGRIAPVHVPVGPPANADQELHRRAALERAAVRETVLGRVAVLQQELTAAHDRLAAALRCLEAEPPPAVDGVQWLPGWWDAPPVLVDSGTSAAPFVPQGGPGRSLALGPVGRGTVTVLRRVPLPLVGPVLSFLIDVGPNDVPVVDAAGRNIVGGIAGTVASTLVLGTAGTATVLSAPVVITSVVIGTVVGYTGSKLYDVLLGTPSGTGGGGPRPARSATPAPTVPRTPRPAPGPAPVPSSPRPGLRRAPVRPVPTA